MKGVLSDDLRLKSKLVLFSQTLAHRLVFILKNIVVYLFFDLRASIRRISILLLLKTDKKKTTGQLNLG